MACTRIALLLRVVEPHLFAPVGSFDRSQLSLLTSPWSKEQCERSQPLALGAIGVQRRRANSLLLQMAGDAVRAVKAMLAAWPGGDILIAPCR